MLDGFVSYRRARFATRLPVDRRFTKSHFWIAPEAATDTLRVGFTKFATRILGEIVEFEFEVRPGDTIALGQPVGWFEGFKAVTELYAPLEGIFEGPNPGIESDPSVVRRSPYQRGWLFRARGVPPADALDAAGYAAFLDTTIDRMTGRSA